VTGADVLYQAILEDPGDDAVRLVYADWCEEHGQDERAEHIRLQIEQARLPEDEWDDSDEVYRRRREIRTRLQELSKREKEWLRPLRARRGPLRGRDVYVHFKRGFPHRVSMPAALFLVRMEEIFRRAPIGELYLDDIGTAELERLIHTPGRARVTSLHLSARRGNEPVPLGRLGLSEHLGNLEELRFSMRALTPGEASVLADAPTLAGLKILGVSGQDHASSSMEGDALQRLAGSQHLRGLEAFRLYGARLDGDALGALARSPVFARITALTLCGGSLATEGLRALARAAFRERLQGLSLWGNHLDAAAMRTLASAPPAPALRTLDLQMNRIGNEGADVLTRSDSWPTLRRLILNSNAIGPDGARALGGSPALDNATELDLNDNPIGDAGARVLAASPHLAALRTLYLCSCDITAEGARALADSTHLENIRSLAMFSNRLGKGRKILRDRFGDVVMF
jgi:uncharacterized protein (TIGR02996 family)